MAFASITDVEARRGPLTDADKASAEYLLEAAQSVVEEAIERDEDWIVAAKGSVPKVLRFLVVEKVIRALSNPQGLSSESETLGSYSHTERFNTAASSDLLLSDLEENMARKAVYGTLSGTAQMRSVATDRRLLRRLAPASYCIYGICEEDPCICAIVGS